MKKHLALLVLAASCATIPTSAVVYDPHTSDLYDAVTDLAADWQARGDLPDLSSNRCQRYISNVIIVRLSSEQEWVDKTTLCPWMENGCTSRIGACPVHRKCTPGTLVFDGGPIIYLSPGEGAEGDYQTVRHEAIHMLAACTTIGVDLGHTDPRLWGVGGLLGSRL